MDELPAPPDTGPAWPATEALAGTDAALARPRMADGPPAFALQRDPALWVDVPPAWRVRTLQDQRTDLAGMVAHWRRHGFGYWLVWDGHVPEPPSPGRDDGLLGLGGLRWLWWRGAWTLNVYVRFAVAAQGRGLASAVLGLAVERLDAALAVPVTAVVRTRPANTAMARLATRLQFTDVGTEHREAGTYRVLTRTLGATPSSGAAT